MRKRNNLQTQFSVLLLVLVMITGSSSSGQINSEFHGQSAVDYKNNGSDMSGIAVYPNPATDYLRIDNRENSIISRISVIDILGNIVMEFEIDNIRDVDQLRIPVYQLKNGIYFIEFRDSYQRVTRKVSKE